MKYNLLNILFEKYHESIRKQEREIVMVTDFIKPRVAKIGYALRKNNFKVILLLYKMNKAELNKLEFKCFDEVIFFTDKNDVYQKCLRFNPLVYHIFAEAGANEWAAKLIKSKKKLGKIVYDQYDVYRGLHEEDNKSIYKREKFCLENADGLCCRMFETQYLKRKYGYKFKGKRILFFDYCWNKFQCKNEQRNSGKLRFIYGGRLIEENSWINRYKIEFEGFKYITKIMESNKDYFVIVPSISCKDKKFRSYRNLSKTYQHLIIKEPMSFQQLIRYESHMDYGIDCVELRGELDKYIKEKNKYYATNKYFDYLDAGIPPIYGREGEMFGHYLEKYGGAVHCTLEEMPEKMEELRRNRKMNKQKAAKAREIFAIENQIERLIDFYRKL